MAALDEAFQTTPPTPLFLWRQMDSVKAMEQILEWVQGEGIAIEKPDITVWSRSLFEDWKKLPQNCVQVEFRKVQDGVEQVWH